MISRLALCGVAWGLLTGSVSGKVTASRGQLTLPTYGWSAVRHPYFAGTDKVNIYPYPMQDFLSREKTNRTYETVVLENEYLRITFLPELGGKIQSVLDKTTGQDMFYVNHVVKPGLIGQCGGWTSGGVEWNTGPQGHTVSCLQTVPVVILPEARDGSRAVAIGETERIYGTKWTVVVTLRPGRSFLEERIRIYNPTSAVRPYYFWNCTAAPNTAGFRFIYPMTLGMDHSGEKFFHWPVNEGKDLSRGVNYQDASSIFAYLCDQDFFGSYNDDLDRGAVSFANHHQLPGKKAWTWGHGSYGTMHQADLTDNDGPYNEVQTGPLLTQGEVGRLDPSEAVEWKEWWYPIHGLGGFTFANQDLCVNVTTNAGELRLRLLGTGTWNPVKVHLLNGAGMPLTEGTGSVTPRQPSELNLRPASESGPWQIQIEGEGKTLARFQFPLALPQRDPPGPKPKPETASELVQAGWQDLLFARYSDAGKNFRRALEKDWKSAPARAGLAFVLQDSDPASANREAALAVTADPDFGPGQFALACSLLETNGNAALEHAWQAALDPETAVAARALVAKVLLRRGAWAAAAAALEEAGPWETDPTCRDRAALAHLELGEKSKAIDLARASLQVDPLDSFALYVLWLAGEKKESRQLDQVLAGQEQPMLDVAAEFFSLGQHEIALRLIREFYLNKVAPAARNPILCYWAAALARRTGASSAETDLAEAARKLSADLVFPHRLETAIILQETLARTPSDDKAMLYLGDVYFRRGRTAEARELWKKAAEMGAEPVIAYRALGMAAKTLDQNLKVAREWLEKAAQADARDPIVARDLASVLFDLAGRVEGDQGRSLLLGAKDHLRAAFEAGKGRSDFVALLARAQNRLGEFAETARMLDRVRVTIWEGAHEVHDLFEQAHLALGEEHLKAGRPKEALAEFDRALEYPTNLATGKLENSPAAQVQYQRCRALAALGRKAEAAAAWKSAADEPKSSDTRIETARQQAKEALEKLR